ncbi:Glutamate synthase [NADH], amyloplastic [Lamellibrachia satsuma]|nr:Glutamate synthase [NADH], amyloplastic [Lamellibrachia satsuma]
MASTWSSKGTPMTMFGKALSGGEVVIYPPKTMSRHFKSEDNIIVGNVVLYGATSGKAFFRGQTAERFCVRNSGATAICEGCGDHGCEYMTGGRAVVLGLTGRNFAAGMSGGIAYVLDREKLFDQRCNHESVEVLPVDGADDLNWLRDILLEFVTKTGSELAQLLLDDWPASAKLFVKVFPYEYQRVLAEAEAVAEETAKAELTNLYGEDTIVSEEGLQTPKDQKNFDLFEDDDAINGIVNSENIEPPVSDIEDLVSDDEDEQLDKARGFVKYRRATNQYRPVAARLQDWEEVYNHKGIMKGITKQAARCMDCGVPFCQSENGCPLGNLIPKWNDLVFHNHWKEALQTLLQTNNFPEFTGRCCPAPCEGSCVLAIGDPAVTIKNIENSIIDAAWTNGWMVPDPPIHRTGKTVAIVGSGPSGLAAAAQLNKVGHTVTVYERNDRLGGLLRYGIPTMKLGKDVVQRRVDLMKAEGINFETNVKVGEEVSAKGLLSKSDVLLLCMGSAWARDLPIPGRKLDGIHYAMNFLEKWQRTHAGLSKSANSFINAKDKEVIIIGGGDTGVDCIATSLRQGAQNVTTFEILPAPPKDRAASNPWPLWPKIMRSDYGHEEAKLKLGKDPRIFNIMSKEFVGDADGHVCGIRTVLVNWSKDDTGRWVMKEVPDSEKMYPCDIVVLAMGFLGPEKAIIESLSLNQDPRSNIETSSGSYATNVPHVYAAGDCRRGQSLVVHAINEGRQAARQIDLDLMGRTSLAAAGGVVQPIREMAKPNGVV